MTIDLIIVIKYCLQIFILHSDEILSVSDFNFDISSQLNLFFLSVLF